jgi:hypothetical protein
MPEEAAFLLQLELAELYFGEKQILSVIELELKLQLGIARCSYTHLYVRHFYNLARKSGLFLRRENSRLLELIEPQ